MAEVALTGRRGAGLCALVDNEDLHLVAPLRWTLHTNGYAWARVADGSVFMHRLVTGRARGDGTHVDHANHNKLDNRKSNLRVVTAAFNGLNRRSGDSGAVSIYQGVSRWKGRWRATCRFGGRQHSLGYYDDELVAAAVARAFRRGIEVASGVEVTQ